VLHLLTRTKGVGTDAGLVILPQVEVPDDPGQGAVGDAVAVVLQDLLHPDHVALCACEQLTDKGGELLVGRVSLRFLVPLPPDHPPDRGPGEFEDAADLA